MWAGLESPVLIETWATELAPYTGDDIGCALTAMHTEKFAQWPPTLFEFSDLCRDAKRARTAREKPPAIEDQRATPMPDHVREQLRVFNAKFGTRVLS